MHKRLEGQIEDRAAVETLNKRLRWQPRHLNIHNPDRKADQVKQTTKRCPRNMNRNNRQDYAHLQQYWSWNSNEYFRTRKTYTF